MRLLELNLIISKEQRAKSESESKSESGSRSEKSESESESESMNVEKERSESRALDEFLKSESEEWERKYHCSHSTANDHQRATVNKI